VQAPNVHFSHKFARYCFTWGLMEKNFGNKSNGYLFGSIFGFLGRDGQLAGQGRPVQATKARFGTNSPGIVLRDVFVDGPSHVALISWRRLLYTMVRHSSRIC